MAALNTQFVQRKVAAASPEKAPPSPTSSVSSVTSTSSSLLQAAGSAGTAAAAAGAGTAVAGDVAFPGGSPSRARSKEWLELRRKEHVDVCNALNLDEPSRKLSWDILYRTYQRGIADEVMNDAAGR